MRPRMPWSLPSERSCDRCSLTTGLPPCCAVGPMRAMPRPSRSEEREARPITLSRPMRRAASQGCASAARRQSAVHHRQCWFPLYCRPIAHPRDTRSVLAIMRYVHTISTPNRPLCMRMNVRGTSKRRQAFVRLTLHTHKCNLGLTYSIMAAPERTE